MEDEPIWLTSEDVAEIHDEQLELHGGLPGYKDPGLVESAVNNPIMSYMYGEQRDILALAIRLCFAIVKNHGFNDGNKRTAAFAMIEFLAINGYDLFVPDDEPETPLLGQWVERLAAGAYDEYQMYDRLEHFLQLAD
ncbi:type II toxin-antitoxin system death-on-curing family toxin [Sphingomonas aracearum]|uniref:type II toxin-antitoxin system death-on-curing family toxin n=1 Tax=Sphingomonas aracearum TaxID=2283317 RepID=UPI0015F0D3E7|nr:type II toxin-antitoxin system death-on-curing family toxin [Sphingomonas aracearum]